MAFLVLWAVFHIANAQIYGCDICECDFDINYATCMGPGVVEWPPFPYFNNSMTHLAFVNTFISHLPTLEPGEYVKLSVLQVFNCPYLNCSELISFSQDNMHIQIATDKDCFQSTSERTSTQKETSVYMVWTDEHSAKMITDLETVTYTDSTVGYDHQIKGALIAGSIIFGILSAVIIGYGIFRIVSKFKNRRRPLEQFILDMEDMQYETEL